ncbi:MAG TPA: FixH family protein, partial [Thermoanaerobaculia bacterium]|nr:FixH family protein [Thermoanaerobaculia bacterium]
AAASYRLDVDVSDDAQGVTIVAAEPDSALTLSTYAAPLSRQPGEPVTLRAELRDGDAPISGATVSARLFSPRGRAFDFVTLKDEGNGVYAATIADLPEHAAGAWQVRFDAEGATKNGVRFARTGSGELVAERGAARLGTPRIEVVGDMLRITAAAEMRIAGTYRFDVIVARDGQSLAWGEGARTLELGPATLSIDLPLASVGSLDNLFIDARLLGLDSVGVAGRTTLQTH